MSAKNNKITIKPFKHMVQMDPNYAQKTWKLLEGAIHEIHKQNASGLSFEELYRNAYYMVLHKYGDVLYKGLKDVVNQHLAEVAEEVALAVDDNFLSQLEKAWTDHKLSMLMIRDILMYMDRVYVSHNNVPTVYDLGLELFRENIARSAKIKDRLLFTILSLIQKERTGEVIDRGLLKSTTHMLIDLGVNSRSVYEEDFENSFLQSSAMFYKIESQDFITSNSCPVYMKKVEQRLREEMHRVAHYLDGSTESKIKDVCEKQLISDHMKTLVEMENSGLISMLRDDKRDDLNRMYLLLQRVPKGLDIMRDVMYNYVRETGKSTVTDEETIKEQGTYVQALLDMKDKYDLLLVNGFSNDKKFQHALHQAFEYFINLNNKSPEYLSLFIDNKLKRGLKGISEEEVERTLDKVMMLFRFLEEKDVFEKYYKQHLAKRLLLGRSVSDDAERNMITKLKSECGFQFTSKLEGMFTDMRISSDTMQSFKEHISGFEVNPLKGVDLSVHVLTTGFWPTTQLTTSNLPQEIINCCSVFKTYYLNNHNGRRLTWQTNMGTAELKASFSNGAKKHELNVSTYQMCILLLFNDRQKISYKEISETTGIPILDLKRSLFALSGPKYRILLRDRQQQVEDVTYEFNEKFRSKLYKVKIMNIIQKETPQEASETRQKVDEDRKHQIEASIVRTMKSRKKMEHSNLISEVTTQLGSRFMPNPVIIKKRIESLIEREYLERSKEDRKMYHYLA